MIKFTLRAAAALLIAGFAWSQAEVGTPDATKIGIDTAQQRKKEVSVEKFENAGFWLSRISTDDGVTTTRQFIGGPAAKEQLKDEKDIGLDPKEADKFVIGTRVDYFRRGYHTVEIYPQKPIPVQGICKTVSVWVVGRNYNHTLKLVIQDFFGTKFELYVGKLNFQGWKKLTVAIPPQGDDGKSGIVQRNYHYNNVMGIKILGFKIETDPMESYGSYYIYFDDLRVETDLFAEDNRDADDMPDNW
jgi:hypothetical protein